jgi:metal-responsive CopG/Arc/MetJ family transcriptional regulator
MKSIQVLFDEPLLERLDAHEDVRRLGRSAVLRRAAAEYLRRHRARVTSERYARAYGKFKGLGEEFAGWPNEGEWPEK